MGFNSGFKGLKCFELKIILVINLRKKIVYFSFYLNLKIVRFFCRTLYIKPTECRLRHISDGIV